MERHIDNVKFNLLRMGLNEYQASALSHLIYLGETKATTLSKTSGVPNARIYGILGELSKRGLVTIRPGRPTLYTPMTPEEISSALIADAREEIRRKLNILEEYREDFETSAKKIFNEGGKVSSRVPLLRIVNVGEVSLEETRKLYSGSEEKIMILTRAMEYYDDVKESLVEVAKRGVSIKIIMMSKKNLELEDLNKRDEILSRIKGTLGDSVDVRLSDEVIIRGCIVDPDSKGSALFLVEEVGVPFFFREAAITSHPGVVKGLANIFELMWKYNSKEVE
jgi:sugar-specific transcriptional regulator TrmB